MSHLHENLAEFVFEELSAQEMAEARSHVAQCSSCREQAEQFRLTHAMLTASPDLEPPRRLVFEFEKHQVASWIWRWLAPMAASAAVALAIVSFAPRTQQQPQIVRVVQPTAQPAAQPIDYDRIIEELRKTDQAWLADELKKRNAAQNGEIQRLRGELISVYYSQQKIERKSWDTDREIQLIAAKAGGEQ